MPFMLSDLLFDPGSLRVEPGLRREGHYRVVGLMGGACTLLGAVALAFSSAAGADETNFSQRAGFRDYFATHPPARQPADSAGRTLLWRHRPRFLLPPGHAGPIDFYGDYVAGGTIVDGEGRTFGPPLDRAALNAHLRDPRAVFVPGPLPSGGGSPVVLGSIDRAQVPFETPAGVVVEPLIFLTWHLVFARSGLPAGLRRWQETLLGAVADLDDWHQLDHYTAATLALDGEDRPVALLLQQHNYTRTYLLGEQIQLPSDGRPRIDVAERSNELFPHRAGRQRRQAVRFLTPQAQRYLMGHGPGPFLSADDVTEGLVEIDYRLDFLPGDDAFYLFQGFLGERRLLPGRDGPPGAAYNTLPELKPWPVQAFVGYWREGDEGDRRRFEQAIGHDGDRAAFARLQRTTFWRRWRCPDERHAGCAPR